MIIILVIFLILLAVGLEILLTDADVESNQQYLNDYKLKKRSIWHRYF